jgi:hypothetical protein
MGRAAVYAWERGALGLRCVGLLRRFDLESPSSVVVQNILYLRHVLDDTTGKPFLNPELRRCCLFVIYEAG